MSTTNQKSDIQWTPYLASAYAEGWCEGENATIEERIEAYAYLIGTGLINQLQGSFGRQAKILIHSSVVNLNGEIDWNAVAWYKKGFGDYNIIKN